MMMDVQDALQQELRKAKNREEVAKRKVSRLKYRLDKLDTAFQNAKEESYVVLELKEKLRQSEARNRELSVWRDRFLDASAELTISNTRLQSSQESIAHSERQKSKSKADLEAMRVRLEYLEAERQRSHEQIRQRDLHLDSTRDALQSARTQLMTSRCDMLELDSKVDELTAQKAEMAKTIAGLEEQLKKSATMRETLGRTTAELFEARQKLLRHHLAEDLMAEHDDDSTGGVGLLKRATRRVGAWLKFN